MAKAVTMAAAVMTMSTATTVAADIVINSE
jgi:hypothetical protein